MTKRNPIPPGMDYCIDCPKRASKSSRPQSNIIPPGVFDMEFVKPPGYGSRPHKEPLEPDWDTPSASVDNYDRDMPATVRHVSDLNNQPLVLICVSTLVYVTFLWAITIIIMQKLVS